MRKVLINNEVSFFLKIGMIGAYFESDCEGITVSNTNVKLRIL